jgi:hypothetical protein
MIAEYIVKVGAATEQDAKLALSMYFLHRFVKEGAFDNCPCADDKEPWYLAAGAAMNVVFGDIDLQRPEKEYWRTRKGNERAFARENVPDSTVQFASENGAQIEKEVNRLSPENRLCSILSGAAYNICYGRYIKAGGSRGIFSNLYITHIRTLFEMQYQELYLKTAEQIGEIDSWILKPIDAMMRYGVLRRFPRNPNERDYFTAIHNFAEEMSGIQIAMPKRQEKERGKTGPIDWTQRIAKYLDERPVCPQCGNKNTTKPLHSTPIAAAIEAAKPYPNLIYFGWRGCAPKKRPIEIESEWYCRVCYNVWGDADGQ